jgi:8-oxo-dGTP pyrophosphatase MutT (NUDIX family)
MPHLFHALDYTVAVFVVDGDRILLVHHRRYDKWLPIGGHIEIGEDPEAAALRETREESGIEVVLIGERPDTDGDGTRALVAPRFVDVHRITPEHEHVGLIYWARPADPAQATPTVSAEHHEVRWIGAPDLDALQPPLSAAIRWYCLKALGELSGPPGAGDSAARGSRSC